MEHKLCIAGVEHVVVTSNGTVAVDGEARAVTERNTSSGGLLLEVDGSRVEAHLADDPRGTWVSVGGRVRLIEASAKKRRDGPASKAARIVTPMFPATVVSVLVSVGEAVEEGQGVVVVSAMKTEMTLRAPFAGQVRAINAEDGANVSPGDSLVDIDEQAEEPS